MQKRERNPSLNVRKKDLKKILIKVIGCNEEQAESFSLRMLREGLNYVPINRVILPSKIKAIKKVSNSTEILSLKVNKFKQFLDIKRGTYTHRNINESSREYANLSEAAINAYDYANIFYPENEEKGVIEYIDTAIRYIGKSFSFQKFSSYREKIYNVGNIIKEIRENDKPELTKKVIDLWINKVKTNNDIYLMYNHPEDYICFMYVRIESDRNKAQYSDWLDAQIDALSFANSIPKITQLYGDKALVNYNNYMYSKGKKANSSNGKSDNPNIRKEIKVLHPANKNR